MKITELKKQDKILFITITAVIVFSVIWLFHDKKPTSDTMLGTADSIAFATSTYGEQYGTTYKTLTFQHSASGDNRYVVVGFATQNGTSTQCTYGGSAMTQLAQVGSGGSYFGYGWLFGLAAPPTGNQNVICTTTSNGYMVGTALSYTGINQTTPTNGTSTATADTGTALSATTTITQDNAWLSGLAYQDFVSTVSAGADTIARHASINWFASIDSNGEKTPTGNYALNIRSAASGKNRMLTVALAPLADSLAIPSITTNAPTSVSTSTLTANGNITNNNGASSTMRGFVYATSTQSAPGNNAPTSTAYTYNLNENGTFDTGTFTGSITSLATGTLYYFRAYAKNSEGYAYGDEVSTTTLATSPPAGTITLTDLTNNRVYQRNTSNQGSVTVSGTYTGTPTAIQARVINASTSAEVLTWTTVDAAPAGGNFSGTLSSIPQGGWYYLQVRFSNDVSIVSNGTNVWGVGIIVATYGQSNMAFGWYYPDYGGTSMGATGTLSYYNEDGWNTPSSDVYGSFSIADGAVSFGNTLASQYNIPIAVLDFANPGSAITGLKSGQVSYTALSNGVNAVGGSVEYFLYIQGESDGDAGMSQATYKGHLQSLISSVQSDFSRSGETLPFLIGVIGRRTPGTLNDAGWTNVRNADLEVASLDNTVLIASINIDIPNDGIHYTSAGDITVGRRFAQAVMYHLGTVDYYQGPYIQNFQKIDSQTIDVNIVHRKGTDFTATTSITGFRILDDGSAETITSATRQSSTKIRLVVSGTLSGTITADYQWGQNPSITGVINDNSALNLPLEFNTNISEYTPPATVYPYTVFESSIIIK